MNGRIKMHLSKITRKVVVALLEKNRRIISVFQRLKQETPKGHHTHTLLSVIVSDLTAGFGSGISWINQFWKPLLWGS